jgi:proline iminopeptidase
VEAEGRIPFHGYETWWRSVGPQDGDAVPLLCLHGGPGANWLHMKPYEALADERRVVFYDQLGAGHSDHPTDSTLWRTDRFVQELAAVRKALGLERVHLLGTSWGTMLATDYMLTHPTGVQSLILASPALSIPIWIRDADSLKSALPDSIQEMITRHEKDGTYDAPDYQNAMMYYYRLHVARKLPWSPDIDSTFAQLGQSVYMAMCGPSEFTITGSLKDYDRTSRLKEIHVPTLFTAGRYDEATPRATAYYQSLLPGSKMVIFENSAHLTMQDEPEHYVQVIRDFLHEVEGKR